MKGYYDTCGVPKPEPRRRVRNRARRHEQAVKQDVRAAVETRDGYCRVGQMRRDYTDCAGPSQWAHLDGHRRSETRGMKAEARHTTAASAMLCQRHHELEETGRLSLVALDDRGADGALQLVWR